LRLARTDCAFSGWIVRDSCRISPTSCDWQASPNSAIATAATNRSTNRFIRSALLTRTPSGLIDRALLKDGSRTFSLLPSRPSGVSLVWTETGHSDQRHSQVRAPQRARSVAQPGLRSVPIGRLRRSPCYRSPTRQTTPTSPEVSFNLYFADTSLLSVHRLLHRYLNRCAPTFAASGSGSVVHP
jgi:hypothetical protein